MNLRRKYSRSEDRAAKALVSEDMAEHPNFRSTVEFSRLPRNAQRPCHSRHSRSHHNRCRKYTCCRKSTCRHRSLQRQSLLDLSQHYSLRMVENNRSNEHNSMKPKSQEIAVSYAYRVRELYWSAMAYASPHARSTWTVRTRALAQHSYIVPNIHTTLQNGDLMNC